MLNLIPLLLGFFSSAGPIAKFFINLGRKVSITAIIMPVQFALMGALIVARIAYITALVTLVIWIYNRLTEVLEMITNVQSSGVLGMLFNFLSSIGFLNALNFAFSYFSLVMVTLFILYLSRMVVNNIKSFSDEYYKIGMLIQQGLS